MEGMVSYTQAAMERAMKVQEVILRAMAKKITWWQAAEIIGISDRQMRRWHERYEEFGFRGLFDRRRGKPSSKKVPLAVVEKVLGLDREKYFDLNVRHFHEKLQEEHQVAISYSWVKGLLQGAGMVAKGRKRGDGANAASAPGRAGCRRNCGCGGSGRWRRRMPFCGSITSESSIAASRSPARSREAPLCPAGGRICSAFFRCNSNAR